MLPPDTAALLEDAANISRPDLQIMLRAALRLRNAGSIALDDDMEEAVRDLSDELGSIVVAGFAQDDLDITFQSNLLTVTGRKQEAPTDGYLHRGIAGQPFEQRFELADHLRVNGADLKNGLLSVDLVREIPDALKPRKIDIQSEHVLASPAAPAQIEAQKAA
jgi:hypothetical protein